MSLDSSNHSQGSANDFNDFFQDSDVLLDTECFLLLGLLYCRDRLNQKAQIFYSLLRSSSQTLVSHSVSARDVCLHRFEGLYCMDEAVESTIFKLCVLSSMFVAFHALPARAGKTEVKLLQTAFALRQNVYFKVFQTFIQHITKQPE